MALVVETGSGLSTANAYVAVADVTSYASDRNYTAWAALTTAQKEAAIIDATLYLDAHYTFLGTRVSSTQALAWPRSGASDMSEGVAISSTSVPLAVKRSAMELAVKSSNGTALAPDLAHGGAIKSETVGPISVTYSDGAPSATLFMITGLLKGLIRPADTTYGMVGHTPSYSVDAYFTPGQFDNNGDVQSSGGI